MAELHATTGFLAVQGTPLYYEETAQGYPLLLIHAGVADSRMWDQQVPVFAQQYRVICFDLRGFGRSSIPAGLFTSYKDPALLLEFLGLEKAHVIGISFGGKVALDFALAYPEKVASLVLVAPSVGGHMSPPEVQQFNVEEEELLERGDLEGAAELNLRMWVDGPRRSPGEVDPTVRQRVREMLNHALAIPTPETAEDIPLEPAAITRLAEIHVPTLLVVGDYDIPDKIRLAEQLASEIPQSQLVIIHGVAHMANMERPEEFNQIVLDFLTHLG